MAGVFVVIKLMWGVKFCVIPWNMSTWWLSGKENPKFWNENWHIFVFKQWPKSVKTTLMVKVEFELKTWHMPQIKNNWSDRVLNWNNDKCYLCCVSLYLYGKTLGKITISLDQWLITINPIVLFPCLSLTNLSSSLYNNPKLFRQSGPIWSRQCNLSLPPFKLTSEPNFLVSCQ